MFKNIIDSFLIIDAKDKPAPSFLTAYIFTWLVWHYETTLAFFKTKGDFTTRFNSSINITTENQWFIVLCLTFGLVILRFALNNAIYYVREFIDNKTQGRLNEKGHKSFVSNEVYQKLSAKASSLNSELLSSQDREKAAKKLENEATSALLDMEIEKNKVEADYKTVTALHDELIEKLKTSGVVAKKNEQENEKLKNDIDDLLKINQGIKQDNVKTNKENDNLVNELAAIKQKLKIWGKNSDSPIVNLIGRSDDTLNKDEEQALSILLSSSIIYTDTSREELDLILSRIKLTDHNIKYKNMAGIIDSSDKNFQLKSRQLKNQQAIINEGLKKNLDKLS
ncbi:MAG: hypothetical protein OQK09_16945 [Colwellia sp.]|nr:hypothetical protein [Colwellia sp.]MCW8866455.1 hypothetical protein [Colwellia sp.]MCW9083197.1 hypothetical protein [Colwellia sp.]